MEIDPMKVLAIINERDAAMATCWNIYLAICTAVLSLMISGKPFTATVQFKRVVSGGFLVAAISCHLTLFQNSHQKEVLLSLINTIVNNNVISAFQPFPSWYYFVIFICLDIVIICCIWLIKWQSRKA